jgi:hypothetical protein
LKKTLLLVETLLVLGAVGCGHPDEPGSDALNESLATSAAELTTPSCTQLTATSVIARDHDGNIPGNAMDDQLGTRWSSLGKGTWIDYDLGASKSISGISIAWHSGNLRKSYFTVSTSTDGLTYTQAYTGTSSGTTTAAETVSFTARTARRVRITVNGNSVNDWASIAEARACAAPASAPAPSVVWRGDFETGTRSQWSGTQMVNADRLAIVSSPLRQGRYALKATVRQGDNPISASGNRNELYRYTNEKSGDEYYYSWSTMFASDFPNVNTWQLFTQWHHSGCCGSPPVEFYVYGSELRLRVNGTEVWKAPMVRGQWNDFTFHVKWSPYASTGFIELWHQNKPVVSKRYMTTMFSGTTNYLKMGLYRNSTVSQVGVVYHDGFIMGRTLADVNPALAASLSTVATASAE